MRRTLGLVFHAALGPSDEERLVERGRWAATLGLLERLSNVGLDALCVVTPDPARCPDAPRGVEFVTSGSSKPFRFGHVFRDLIRQLGPDGVVYFGSGSGGLLPSDDLARLVEFARGPAPRALFNNFYSCDFCAIAGAQDLLTIDLPDLDNPLGFVLADAGFSCLALPRNAATQFDIDTPTDLLLLGRSDQGSPEVRKLFRAMGQRHPTLDRALAVFTERSAVACLVGRLSPLTWSHVETQVACRTSALVEGRGMRAGAGPHVPWLRQVVAEDGAEAFFDRLARSCDAAWIDSRPLLGATDDTPSPRTRFSSDLFRVDQIDDRGWQAFTEAALGAKVPVVLGGHSLVSGGLYLAAEACWKGRNLARRLHPEPFV